ncbi:SlyX protein [Roseivivax halotolerans]|jgi:SlyX protein|uniref:SlyX protein n=1 Tax=Roseivivax halotolerans TaxID=93684 RepID=A0A1I5YT53_9RHOB|nr:MULTISPECIES: SlyX family protein [Roseivivax]QFT61871.1 hypothetical protein FIU91_02925 [Roseivivax sp. THAF30]SFQ47215.1 SlyX protein [Roseivivax halotolerans]
MSERIDRIEERLAELLRQTDELSEVIARQDRELDRLQGQVALLLRREAERESDQTGAHLYGDEKPPHW